MFVLKDQLRNPYPITVDLIFAFRKFLAKVYKKSKVLVSCRKGEFCGKILTEDSETLTHTLQLHF
jgi:hypothetical protein